MRPSAGRLATDSFREDARKKDGGVVCIVTGCAEQPAVRSRHTRHDFGGRIRPNNACGNLRLASESTCSAE